jgi:hypothetical protein
MARSSSRPGAAVRLDERRSSTASQMVALTSITSAI